MGRTERGTAAAAPGRGGRVRLVSGIVLLVALVVGGVASFPWLRDHWNDWTHELRDRAATVPELRLEEQQTLAGSESMLIMLTDEDRRGVAFALLSRAGDEPATLVLVPAALYDILPGYGDFPLADATVFEGPELARLTVSNVLGVRIDRVMALGPGDLAAALGSDLEVTLPSALIVEEPDGTPLRVAAEGTLPRSPDVVETILTTPGTSGTFDWLERQAAVWEALMAAMEHDPELTDRLAAFAGPATETATGILARAAAGDVQVTLLPVVAVSAAGVDDGFKVDPEAAADFVSSRLGHLLLAERERPRIEILNGNGRILTTRTVATTLIRAGFRVVNTDNADSFDYEESLVVAQGREHQADAERVLSLLGRGSLLLELRTPSGVVDVSIIVGQDLPVGEG
jgi:hypothetical protein